MARFMGFSILNDEKSFLERSEGRGFIEQDIPMLLSIGILKKQNGKVNVNQNLVKNPNDIRDFIAWAGEKRKLPLPPLARRILCLKRSIILNSISSIGTSPLQRTGEKQQLEEIEQLLRSDGAVDLNDPEKCATEGSAFVPKRVGGTKTNQTATTATATADKGCVTTVHCGDNSEVMKLLLEIQRSLQLLKQSAGPIARNHNEVSVASTQIASLENKIQEISDKLETFSVPSDPGTVRVNTEPVIRAIESVLKKEDLEPVQENIQQILQKLEELPESSVQQSVIESVRNTANHTNIKDKLESILDILQKLQTIESSSVSEIQSLRNALQSRNNDPEFANKIEEIINEILESRTIQTEDTNGIIAILNAIRVSINTMQKEVAKHPEDFSAIVQQGFAPIQELLEKNIVQKIIEESYSISSKMNVIQGNSQQRTNELKQLLEAQSSAISTLQSQLSDMQTSLASKQESHRANSEARLTAVQENIASLRELIQATSNVGEHTELLHAIGMSISNIQSQIRSLQQANTDGKNNASIAKQTELLRQIEELEERIRQINTNTIEKQARIEELETQIYQKETDIQRLQSESPRKNATIRSLENINRQKDEQIRQLQTEIETLQSELQDYVSSKTSLQSEIDQMKLKLEKEYELLKVSFDAMKKRRQELESALEFERIKHTQNMESHALEVQTLQERIRTLEEEKHKIEMGHYLNEVSQKEESATQLRAIEDELRKCREQQKVLESNEIQRLESMLADVQKNLDDCVRNKSELESRVEISEKEITELQTEMTRRNAEYKTRLENEIADCSKAIEDALEQQVANENTAHTKYVESMQKKLKEMEEAHAKKETENIHLRQQVAELVARLETVQKTNDASLREKYETLMEEKELALKEKETAQKEKEDCEKRVAELQEQYNALRTKGSQEEATRKAEENAKRPTKVVIPSVIANETPRHFNTETLKMAVENILRDAGASNTLVNSKQKIIELLINKYYSKDKLVPADVVHLFVPLNISDKIFQDIYETVEREKGELSDTNIRAFIADYLARIEAYGRQLIASKKRTFTVKGGKQKQKPKHKTRKYRR